MSTEHENWQDAAATYLLGALPEDERGPFEAHLESCPDCRAELDDLRVAAEALPVAAPPMRPPPALKARIMAEVEREAALLASASEPRRAEPPRRRWSWRLSWPSGAVAALACAALLVGLGAGALVFGGGSDGRSVSFKSSLPQASAELEINGDKATIVAHNLPPAPGGKVYMVWLKRPGQAPEPTSALFTPRADGSATAAVTGDLDGVHDVIVNTEPPGGSTTPTSDPVLTAALT
jgi:anti-sigma-K factor RskA